MKNMLSYRGYYGTVEYSDEDECFLAVDSYLESCEERGKEPDKFYKGSFNIRIAPELHKKAALAAEQRHQTLNSFVESAICTMVSTIL